MGWVWHVVQLKMKLAAEYIDAVAAGGRCPCLDNAWPVARRFGLVQRRSVYCRARSEPMHEMQDDRGCCVELVAITHVTKKQEATRIVCMFSGGVVTRLSWESLPRASKRSPTAHVNTTST